MKIVKPLTEILTSEQLQTCVKYKDAHLIELLVTEPFIDEISRKAGEILNSRVLALAIEHAIMYADRDERRKRYG